MIVTKKIWLECSEHRTPLIWTAKPPKHHRGSIDADTTLTPHHLFGDVIVMQIENGSLTGERADFTITDIISLAQEDAIR